MSSVYADPSVLSPANSFDGVCVDTPLSDPRQCLAPLRHVVLQARSDFLQCLAELPEGIGGPASEFFLARCNRNGAYPLLAEFIPWLTAEALAFDDRQTTSKVSTAWLHVYTAICMLDDVIDERRERACASRSIVIATLLLQRGLGCVYALGGLSSQGHESLNEAFQVTALAHLDPPQELRHLWSKTAVFMSVLESLAALEPSIEIDVLWMRRVNRALGTAWQGLDDVTDFEQDYLAGNLTPLLRLTAELRQAALPPGLSRHELLSELVTSGALEKALVVAHESFIEAIMLLGRHQVARRSMIRKFVLLYAATLGAVIIIVQKLHSSLSDIEQALTIVAQGS